MVLIVRCKKGARNDAVCFVMFIPLLQQNNCNYLQTKTNSNIPVIISGSKDGGDRPFDWSFHHTVVKHLPTSQWCILFRLWSMVDNDYYIMIIIFLYRRVVVCSLTRLKILLLT